ncbi:MAG: amidase [Acidobacteriota bacterium]
MRRDGEHLEHAGDGGEDPVAASPGHFDRRRFNLLLAAVGASLPAALWAEDEAPEITREVVRAAEQLAGLELTDDERDLMLAGLTDLRADYRAVRAVAPGNEVAPAQSFAVLPAPQRDTPGPMRRSAVSVGEAPRDLEELAFRPVTELAELLRRRQVTSVALTRMYLGRLERWNDLLECVVTLTSERAMAQAEAADREIAAGRWRGPLHGVPWGAKDLLAVKGYPTTWGAEPYREQRLDTDAAVVRRLDDAGAVLVAKLTLGALAWGDVWFGGKTRNPWNPEQGSSGSSAGSASATAAGLVAFAIGTETWGSIVSPSTRCGVTGLRPTFGRVSRTGAMALSWTMDKIGPIARSVEDCALVFDVLHGADPPPVGDPTAVDRSFRWDAEGDPRRLKVGYTRSLFEKPLDEDADQAAEEVRAMDLAALAKLRQLGVELLPFELPSDLPVSHLSYILSAEAAAAFDHLTLSGDDDRLVRQIANAWPNVFRQARTIPAVEYLQASRVRRQVMERMEEALGDLDAYVVPSFGGNHLLLTNLTGHPTVVVPHGFKTDGTPASISFVGRLWGESDALRLAKLYQDGTDFHSRRPDLAAVETRKTD